MTDTGKGFKQHFPDQKGAGRSGTEVGMYEAFEDDIPDYDARAKETGLKVSKATLKRRENQIKERERKHTRDISPDNAKRKPPAKSAFRTMNSNFFKQE